VQITTVPQAICPGSALTLNANGSGTIYWTGGASGNSLNINSPGNYTASVTNFCGTATDTVVITAQSSATAQIQSNVNTICPGDTAILSASGNGVFTWNTGSAAQTIQTSIPGIYVLTATNICGTAVDSINIQSSALPTVQIQTPQTQLCTGQTLVLQANGTSPWTWFNGSGANSVTISQAGTYFISATNACGSVSDSVTITSLQTNPVQVTAPSAFICAGQTLVLSAVANGNVLWNNGSAGNTITINSPGWYIASSSGPCGTETDSIYIGTSAPQASFSWTSNSTTAPAEISLINTSQNFSNSEWTLDNQDIGNSIDATTGISAPGTYLIGLTVTDLNGCTDEVKEYITLRCQEFLYIPNSFTPNGDEINEEFKILITGHKKVEISIYNRWGERLYLSADESLGWNGIYSGKKVPSGGYVYKVSGTWNSGSDFIYTGSLTVFSAQ
jgi:gliding motility-associated-like protein